MKKNIRLILSDMDGTLLNDKKEIPTNTYAMIERCLERGIIFGIASGRQLFNLQHQFEPFKDQLFYVAENGAYSYYQKEVLHFSKLEDSVIIHLIQKARTLENAWPVLCGLKGAYIECKEARLIEECKKYYYQLTVVDDLLAVKDDFCKISICDLAGSEFHSNHVFAKEKESLQITVSADIWLDICNQSESKGKAVELFQSKMGISVEETMAFGDYLNDMTLMPRAYYSYAMANAHPELAKITRFKAPSNEEGGVVQIVEQFLDE